MDRTRKTNTVVRRNITDALIELMGEKQFESITISEITERAEVARVSFYRNFSGKADVLRKAAQLKTEQFLESIEPGLRQKDPRAYVTALLEHMRDNREVIELMMGTPLMDIIREEFDRA
ncbi:MAG: TetR/AcrR family transcriptional regulator, partial [Atopobiaceae bacterium]|nr:TetR/AcrR family transcriptional regulator [Atopobiaceae bacterium]